MTPFPLCHQKSIDPKKNCYGLPFMKISFHADRWYAMPRVRGSLDSSISSLCIASKINVTTKDVRLSEKLQLTAALCNEFDRSNKFDLCYYGQVNSLRLKSSVASKWANKYLLGVTFILLAMAPCRYKNLSTVNIDFAYLFPRYV